MRAAGIAPGTPQLEFNAKPKASARHDHAPLSPVEIQSSGTSLKGPLKRIPAMLARLYGCGPASASWPEARHDLLKEAWCAGCMGIAGCFWRSLSACSGKDAWSLPDEPN